MESTGTILGIGIDLVDVSRIERAVARRGDAFLEKVFTSREVADCGEGRSRFQRLAARFAAKEAVFKALGQGRPGLGWREVEVVRAPSGQPGIVLTGKARERARKLGVSRVVVSLTHLATLAAAEVICID